MRQIRLPSLLAGAGLLLAPACATDTTNPPSGNTTPSSISVVSGNGQSGLVGAALGSPLVVRVTNSAGAGLSGVSVDWSVIAGGGVLGAASSTTDAQGQAQVAYTLGATPGANTVRATVRNTALSTDFGATATAALDNTPATIEIVSGDNQSATVTQQLPQPLVVRVRNAAAQVLNGIAVAWSVAQGGGQLGSASSTTNSQGQAQNTYTVGSSAGSNQVTAAVQSNPSLSVTFNATANAVTGTASVTVDNNFFTPNNALVLATGTVTWTWVQNALTHNITWVSGGFPNASDRSSGTHQVTFPTAGTFSYYCSIHSTPTTGPMRGTVTVQ